MPCLKRSKILLSCAVTALIASGCVATLGLDTPVKQQGEGTRRTIVGTLEETRAGAHAVFGKMGSDFAVSDQGNLVQAVFDKNGVVMRYKAFLSPGPAAGRTDVEMVCEMFSRVKIEDIKKCEERFLNGVADTVELARLRKGASPENVSSQSDIDELPAGKTRLRRNSYAIVIGIESYRQKLPQAEFAASDAKLVAAYLTRTLGYPEENVITLLNDHATKGDFEKYFERYLVNNVESGGAVFIYFSGHGAPNPTTGDAYLVPYDGDPAFIEETGYSLKRMYAALGKLPAKEVTVALDSCFSGAGGRSVIAKGARPLVMNLKTAVAAAGNMTILAASSGGQISSTYDEKGHGLFTYFLLKGIKNEDVVKQDGSLDIPTLFDYVKPQVTSIARKKYNNEQTPQLIGAGK